MSFASNIANALKRLAELFIEISSDIENLEEYFVVINKHMLSTDDDLYLLERSRKRFRLRKISKLGISQSANVEGLTEEEAWNNRLTLEYS